MENEASEEIKKVVRNKYKKYLMWVFVIVLLTIIIFLGAPRMSKLNIITSNAIALAGIQADQCAYGFCNTSTFINSTLANYSYQSSGTAYTLYLMNDSDLSKAASFVANGYTFTFDTALSQEQYYNSTLGAVVGGILNPLHSNISINGSVASYPNAWQNITLVYNLSSSVMKENLVINNSGALPANSSIADFFRFRTDLYYNSSLKVCLTNGTCYLHPSSVNVNTTGKVDFRDSNNNTIFSLPPITITDNAGNSVTGTYFMSLNNGVDIWYIAVPTSFLSTAVYPVTVDPSIIEIIKAEWLDSNRNFIQNVYSNVSVLDGVTALIPSGNYLRVVFAQNLTNGSDITIYASGDNPADSIQVSEAGSNTSFASFSNVGAFGKYRILLTNLSNDSTNAFDLLSNGNINYDYVVDPTWYNTSFNNCRNITIVNTTSSVLNNFPVFVNITNTTGMQTTAYRDLVFVNTSCNNGGTALNFEIENYTATNVLAWVQTNLSAANTTISVYYTNTTNVNPPDNASATWSGSGGVYMGVWHFGLNSSAGLNTSDSTGRGNNGQPINKTAYVKNTFIDGAANFTNSSNMTVLVPNTANTTLPAGMVFTIMIWFSGNNGTLFGMQNAMINKTVSSYDPFLYIEVNGTLHGGIYTGSNPTMQTATSVASTTPASVWHFAALIVNKTQNNQTLYVDGVNVANWTGTPEGPWNNTQIGTGFTNGISWAGGTTGWDYLNGSISEVQIVNNSGSMQLVNQTYATTFNQSTTVFISTNQSQPTANLLRWSNPSTNSTIAGTSINHTVTLTSSGTLSNYTFSFDNGTGTFVNDTTVTLSVSTTTINITKNVNTTVGTTIRWIVYANDSVGDVNNTGIQTYTTTNFWANNSYSKCKNINITNAGATALTNYPSFVNISYASSMQSNFNDVAFYSQSCNLSGNALPFEIENYTSSGFADMWVLTNLTAGIGTNTTISMYYGNSSLTNSLQNSTAVWGIFNNYAAVYHLGDLGTGSRNDSTIFRNNLTATNFTGTETNSSGQIDGAVTLNGSKYLQSINNIGIVGQQSNTITFWVNIRNISSNVREPMVSWGNATSNGAWLADIRSGVYFFWGFATGDWTTTGTPVINTWQYEAITFNGTTMNWSVSGKSIGTNARIPLVNASKLFIGYENDSGIIYALNGTIDEVEISNVTRSNDWINQSFYMQQNQSTYVGFGPEVSNGATTNSCTYSGSGNWAVSCSDNCAITTSTNLNFNNISFVGAGTIVVQANITNWTQIYKANGCTIYKPNTYQLIGRT